MTAVPSVAGATVQGMPHRDADPLIAEFQRRLDELEELARDITARLTEEPAEPDVEQPFEVVLICTGNRARSPVAEGFLRTLTDGLPVRVSSVGVLDLGPVPALPEAVETAAALGLDISAHRARCVLAHDLSGADLVLGFERRHVATAVVDARAPRERTFTILELVELLERIDPPSGGASAERARAVVARAAALRRQRAVDHLDEVPDPLGGSRETYRETISRVRSLCERVAVGLFGEASVRPRPVDDGSPEGARRRSPTRPFARDGS